MFWIVAVLGATGMFVFQVSDLFRHYLSRPVQTSVTVTFEKQLKFPAVTICNLNVIRKSKMTMLPMHLIDKFFTVNITKNRTPFDIFTDNLFGDLNGTLGSGFNTSDYFDGAVNNVTEETDDGINSTSEPARRKNPPSDGEEGGGSGGDNRTPEDRGSSDDDDLGLGEIFPDVFKDFLGVENSSPDMILKMNVESYIGGEDPDRLISYGHQQENLIKSCTWKGVDCAKGNLSKLWTSSWNYKYGNCYTFNNGVDYEDSPIEVLQSSKPGPSQGLVLQLDIEENEYIGELSNEAGVRVVLHEQGVMHFPYEEGFSVAPGMATSVGITKTMMKRLDRFDDGSCFDKSVQLAKDNLYRGKQNITRYSMQACLNSCLGVSQLAMCKCADVSYPTGKPCDLFNPREMKYLFQ
ncbi:amiloride-sensitive sodium channel subunit alpha-like [Dendronephthya gigantea]|uniref:amiloride-sensitive sodium channel subunit alpha-like n=1 Tax=Dendronephthya gigantea TaxID=151771 RepID=UPI001069AD3C|nr:amiloride-sensitive sodium channel subunit alpha-like [Dendronephthya gigantea]